MVLNLVSIDKEAILIAVNFFEWSLFIIMLILIAINGQSQGTELRVLTPEALKKKISYTKP